MPGAGAELYPGGVEIAVDGLGRDAQAKGDLFAAVTLDHVAEAVPLSVREQIGFDARVTWTFPHESSFSIAAWRDQLGRWVAGEGRVWRPSKLDFSLPGKSASAIPPRASRMWRNW